MKRRKKQKLLIPHSEAKNNKRSLMEFLFLRKLVTRVDIFLQPINAPFRVDARKRHAVQSMI